MNPTTSTPNQQPRLMLLCTPRSTATSLLRSLSQLSDASIYFDPYYACYEAEYNLKTMGKTVDHEADDLPDEDWRRAAEMIAGQDCSDVDLKRLKFRELKKSLDSPQPDKNVVICKSSCSQLVGKYRFLPDKSSNYKYAFLLRHPIKVFDSWRNALYTAQTTISTSAVHHPEGPKSRRDFHQRRDSNPKYLFAGHFFKCMYDLWVHVKENLDPNPVIMDSEDLLSNPAQMLPKFCAAVGLPYTSDMLSWDGNPDSANDWHVAFTPMHRYKLLHIFTERALTSTEFFPPSEVPPLASVPQCVQESVEFAMPYYEEMYNLRMKP